MITRYRENGFTLLEIVVVLVVVATLATLAVLSIGNLGRDEMLQTAAQKLVLAVDLGAEEAALGGHPIGLDISGNGYEFLIYQHGEWQAFNRGRLFDPQEFDASVDIRFDTANDSEPLDGDAVQPTLVLLPDGERWLRPLALVDSETNSTVTLMPVAGNFQVEDTSP